MWVPASGRHARGDPVFSIASKSNTAGKTGNTTCASVVMKSCIMLGKGTSISTLRTSRPPASTTM
jgi:hypothetical protein